MTFNLKLFFTFVIFGIFLALFSSYSFTQVVNQQQLENEIKHSNECITRRESKISTYIQTLDNHLYSLSNNEIFQKYLKNSANKEYVTSLFKTLISSGHDIFQIQYTDYNKKSLDVIASTNSKNQYNLKYVENFTYEILKKQNIGSIWHSKIGMSENVKQNTESLNPIFVVGINMGSGILRFYVSVKVISQIISDDYHNLLLLDNEANLILGSRKNLAEIGIVDITKLLQEKTVQTKKYISKRVANLDDMSAAVLILIYPNETAILHKEMYYASVFIYTIIFAVILAYLFSKPMAKNTYNIERLNNKLDRKVEQRTQMLNESLRIIDKNVIRSITDTEGRILDVSEAFCRISQYSKKELIGKKHSIVRHPDMKSVVFKDLWNTINQGKIWEGKLKNLSKDGSYYWVDAHIEPNFVEDRIVSFTAIRTNITDKLKLEELNKSLEKKIKKEVKKNTEQLKQIQKEQLKSVKLSSIGALSAGITHEINTPLTYIKGNFELMKFDIDDLEESIAKERIKESTETITDGLNRISNIIEAMKEVSTTSSETIESVNIYNTLITALTLSLNNAKQISKIYLNGELFDIGKNKDKKNLYFNAHVQKQRIEQVWIIIISNALDELVKIEEYEKRSLNINISLKENKVIVDFIDNAGGIKEKKIEKIFEPFVSNKERGGMGIGLNVAKKIVEENNGMITASNTLDGAIFRIELQAEGATC